MVFLIQNIVENSRNSSGINCAIVTADSPEDALAAANAAGLAHSGETRFGPLAKVTEYLGTEGVILVQGQALVHGASARGA